MDILDGHGFRRPNLVQGVFSTLEADQVIYGMVNGMRHGKRLTTAVRNCNIYQSITIP